MQSLVVENNCAVILFLSSSLFSPCHMLPQQVFTELSQVSSRVDWNLRNIREYFAGV